MLTLIPLFDLGKTVITPAPCREEWVTPWWNTEAEAIHSAKGKIDVLELEPLVVPDDKTVLVEPESVGT